MRDIEPFKNLRFARLERDTTNQFLKFVHFGHGGGDVILRAVGSCASNCANSQSYFSDIEGLENLGFAEVRSFNVVHNDQLVLEEYSVVDFNAVKIVTEKGYCDIGFRHEHNSYYCGDVEIVSDLSELPEEPLVWLPVTENGNFPA